MVMRVLGIVVGIGGDRVDAHPAEHVAEQVAKVDDVRSWSPPGREAENQMRPRVAGQSCFGKSPIPALSKTTKIGCTLAG